MAALSFREQGSGEISWICLHGFLGSSRNLLALARRLVRAAPWLRVVLPDLQGHGCSPPLGSGADLDTLAVGVIDLARRLELKAPYRLVGHSMGGRVALRAALLDPIAVGEVVILDISPGPAIEDRLGQFDGFVSALLSAPVRSPTRAEMREHFFGKGVSVLLADWALLNLQRDNGCFRWRVDRRSLVEFQRRVRCVDQWSEAQRLGRRLQCIRGSCSDFVPDDEVRRLKAGGCKVHTINGAGHFVHLDAQEDLVTLLLKGGVHE